MQGVGNSPGRAQSDGQAKAALTVKLAVAACANCPDGTECEFSTGYKWNNNQSSQAVWNGELGLWTLTVSWDGCAVTQRCKPC